MDHFDTVFLCNVCGKSICDGKVSCTVQYSTVRKGDVFVSGVLDGVQKIVRGKKLALKCSCGENIGEFVTYKKEMKYCLDLKKVRRHTARDTEHSDTESALSQRKINSLPTGLDAPHTARDTEHSDTESALSRKKINSLPTGLDAPTLSKNIPDKNVTINGEVAELKYEILQLKQTIAAMEKKVNFLESENIEKLKDVCGVLFSQKLEIQRLQEIIWVLHPSFNLDRAFNVEESCLDTYLGNLKIDDD